MNDESGVLTSTIDDSGCDTGNSAETASPSGQSAANIPGYLQDTYWWAYLHPNAVRFWEREWLVNAILWGQMKRLTEAVIEELDMPDHANLLQIACVYGTFSNRLAEFAANCKSRLHVLDVAPIQIANVRRKLSGCDNVAFHLQNSGKLQFRDESFEHAVLYFLLHEQPEDVRRRSLSEALRIIKPGGKVVVVDYHRPAWWNALGAVMWPVLRGLEPFALELWRNPIEHWLTPGKWDYSTQLYFGGLYQKTVIQRL